MTLQSPSARTRASSFGQPVGTATAVHVPSVLVHRKWLSISAIQDVANTGTLVVCNRTHTALTVCTLSCNWGWKNYKRLYSLNSPRRWNQKMCTNTRNGSFNGWDKNYNLEITLSLQLLYRNSRALCKKSNSMQPYWNMSKPENPG